MQLIRDSSIKYLEGLLNNITALPAPVATLLPTNPWSVTPVAGQPARRAGGFGNAKRYTKAGKSKRRGAFAP
jgi:hypothetical protein